MEDPTSSINWELKSYLYPLTSSTKSYGVAPAIAESAILLILQICEPCKELVDKRVETAHRAAKEEIHILGQKLQDLESEAMYEFEELQSELLEARASNEGLRQLLEDSERKRWTVSPAVYGNAAIYIVSHTSCPGCATQRKHWSLDCDLAAESFVFREALS